jgi:glucose-1-phosphate adenylyltransferase
MPWNNKAVAEPMRIRVLGIVLAGGKGTRLHPLTKERAKPAVPFGGKYRIIDFVLSNFINSGIYSLYVLTQFRSQSLLQHLSEGWQFGGLLKSQFVIPVPAQMRSAGETWYQGTADAIYQNINLVEQSDPHLVAIFGGDHIYRMNITSMIEFHVQKKAEVTVAAIPVDRRHAAEFGVIETAEDGHILDFHEKNPEAPTMPGDSDRVYASMGNYVFSTRTLLRLLHDDAAEENSNHDFGRDILPRLAGKAEIYAYDFQTNRIPGEPEDAAPYWRDVGAIDSYYEANMDLRSVSPALNLYNRQWPVRTTSYPDPPAKFTFDDERRRGQAIDSIVSGGCILSGGTVRNSVLGRGVRVHSGAVVEDCVILDNCDVGRRARVRRAILDKNVRIPEEAEVGYDLERDRLYHHVTESGIVVVGGNRTPVEITGLVV